MDEFFVKGNEYSLKEILDKYFEGIRFDSDMAKRLYNFQLRFINLTKDHLAFFSGNLLGVQVIRFTDKEVNYFFKEVVSNTRGDRIVDLESLTKTIHMFCPAINPEFKISSDGLNIVLMYTIHRFLIEAGISDSSRKIGLMNTALIFFYRCVAALHSDWFTWPADPNVAQAAFANLNKKFLIKKVGTWSAVMEYRAKALLHDKESVHIQALRRFNDDYAIVHAMNDSQGRIRSLMKFYYAEFDKVHKGGLKISSSSQTTIDAEGNEVIKDKTTGVDSKLAVFKRVLADEPSFIRDDLIQVVRSINKNSSVLTIKSTLLWLCRGYTDPTTTELVDNFVTRVVSYSYWLIDEKIQPTNKRDYAYILMKLKNLYLSTRMEEPDLEIIRGLGDDIIKRAFNGRSAHKSLILSTRTSIILYVTLRALAT